MGDQPITGKYHEVNAFTDQSNIYAYQKYRESLQVYPQRTSDLVTIETGLQVGVATTIIMSPTIYGIGSGAFNKISIQVPTMMRSAIKSGQAIMIGKGKGIWDYVHIADLARLYELLVLKVIAGEQIPTGESGILFSSTGRYSWRELAENVASALFTVGVIKTDVVRSVDLEEAAKQYKSPDLLRAELGFSSK
jgi:nucleoside-diphosphate-sugar epimerase